MKKRFYFSAAVLLFLFAVSTSAQTTEFTYQGKLSVTGTQSLTYDFEFRLCDSLAADCAAPLAVQQIPAVPVTNGVFTVRLNFNAAVFDGSNRWLEIAVKRPSEANYITLDPRQPLTSAPYAIRALNAGAADNTTLFGGLTIDGFVQNTTVQQTGNFNLSGDGTLGGTLLATGIGVNGAPQAGIVFDVTGASVFRTPTGNFNLGSPNGETGASIINPTTASRADLRFNGSTFKLVAGAGIVPPSENNGIIINTAGNVGIGKNPATKLDVAGNIFTSGFLSVGNGAGITGGLNISNGLSLNSGNLFVNESATINANLNVNTTTISSNATINGSLNVGNGATIANGLRVNSGGISFLLSGGGPFDQNICRNISTGFLGQCGSSSLLYKSGVQTFGSGLSLVKRLRPVVFDWKHTGRRDVGFVAEEVFQIEPLLTTSNESGEIEGVKYQQLSVVFVNAIKEQQAQIEEQEKRIERQQKQIEALTGLVCSLNPQAAVCKEQ